MTRSPQDDKFTLTRRIAMIIRALCLTLGAVSAGGCTGEGAARGPLTAFRDSAGIRIAENPSPDDSARNTWWSLTGTEVDIGGQDAVEPYAVYRVTDALRLDDGRIVVANGGTNEIRIYDRAGVHVRTTGRSGGGPGEFRSFSGLERGHADSVLVFDQGARRVTVLGPAGEVAREVTRVGAAGFPRVLGRFEDGTLLGTAAAITQSLESDPDRLTRLPTGLARFSAADLSRLDSIGEFPGAERVVHVVSRNGQIASIEIRTTPFVRTPTYVSVGLEVFVGAQDAPEVGVYDTSGGLRRIIRTGRAVEAVTERHLEAAFERSVLRAPAERQAQMRTEGRGNLPHGTVVPPYGELIADRAGNLWVSDYDDPTKTPGRWTVYGPDGAVLARIALPERFRPFDIGPDWILGRESDALDVEHVRLYRIVRE